MRSEKAVIINKLGLHARAAAKLVDTTARYQSKIEITFNGKTVDGKSIMSVMLLAAGIGSELEISASGHDEDRALEGVLEIIANRFGEEE